MSKEGSSRIQRDMFADALVVPESDCAAFLDGSCEGDAVLRAQVESLLAAAAKGGSFLQGVTQRSGSGESPGDRIGPFKLLQLIGEGGFGAVYMTDQERPVRRRVALKIKPTRPEALDNSKRPRPRSRPSTRPTPPLRTGLPPRPRSRRSTHHPRNIEPPA